MNEKNEKNDWNDWNEAERFRCGTRTVNSANSVNFEPEEPEEAAAPEPPTPPPKTPKGSVGKLFLGKFQCLNFTHLRHSPKCDQILSDELIEVMELRLAAGAQSFGGVGCLDDLDVLPGKHSKAKEAGKWRNDNTMTCWAVTTKTVSNSPTDHNWTFG